MGAPLGASRPAVGRRPPGREFVDRVDRVFLRAHAASFAFVGLLLCGLWFALGEGAFWPGLLLVPWAMVLAMHVGGSWGVRRLLARLRGRSRGPTAAASQLERRLGTPGSGGRSARPAAGARDRVARRLRLPHDVRGRLDLRRPVRLAGAAAVAAAAAGGAARAGADRPVHRRSRRGRGRARRPHPLRPRGRRPGARAALRLPGVRLSVARAPHAAARAGGGVRGSGSAPAVRARPVRRHVRPQPPLEAAVRAQGADGRRADVRPPPRPRAGAVQVRPGLGDPDRGRRDQPLPPGQRRPRRRTSSAARPWTCSSPAWPAAA